MLHSLKAAVATEGHEEKSWRAKTEICKYRVRQAGATLDLIALLQTLALAYTKGKGEG